MFAELVARHFRTSIAAVAISVASLTAPGDLFAQITAATVSGLISDDTGAALPGVEVTVVNVATGLSRSTVTGDDGGYNIPGLPPGLYEARASLQGFRPAIHSGLGLAVAEHARLNLTMRVGATEVVLVVATPARVDTRTSALSALVDEKTIAELPLNGRNFIDLALLQPGVAAFNTRSRAGASGRGQQININGAAGRANSYLLDGANMNAYPGTAVSTAADTTLGVEMIREFRVVTNAFSADYGRAMGGVISVISKSGTNQFHGSAFEFFRNRALDARNPFDTVKPPFERHQPGFAVGGPLRRNRTFFFGGAERLVENLGVTQVSEVPSLAARSGQLEPIASSVQPYLAMFPAPNGPEIGDGFARFSFPFNRTTRETFVQARVDHLLSDATALFARYTRDEASKRQPTLLPQFSTDLGSISQWLTVEAKHTMAAALLNTARFSYSEVRLGADLFNQGAGADLAFVPGQSVIGTIVIASREFGPDRTNPQHQDVEFFTFSDDVTLATGRHLLKAGVLIERAYTDTENSTTVRGRFTFSTMVRFLQGLPGRFTGVLPGYQLQRTRRNTLFGFYVQDDVAAHPRLTLNLGLRYEFYTVPNDTKARDSALRDVYTDREFTPGPIFENPSLKNFGPRIGFAWDLSGSGKTAVRGGGGLYYDTDGPFASALLAAAFSPPTVTVNMANPSFPRPDFGRATAERAARGIDYHVRQPRMLVGNISWQSEILPTVVVTAGYAASRGYNLVQAIEGNPVVPQMLADGSAFFPPNGARRNPHWDSIDFRTTGGRSWYDALQLGATKRFSRRHRWQVAYTLGQAIDETQGQIPGDSTTSSVFPQNPIDPRQDRGPADFDVRHILAMNVSWALPVGDSLTGVGGLVARGWQLNALGIFRSGVPFSPAIQMQNNWSQSGNVAQGAEDRPHLRAGRRADEIVRGGVDRYFDPTAFELQPRGFLGNAPRNMLTGPGLATFNVSLVKEAPCRLLGANGAIELRVEAFNAFNRTNLGLPNRVIFSDSDVPLATAGQITSTATDARQVQLGIKIKF